MTNIFFSNLVLDRVVCQSAPSVESPPQPPHSLIEFRSWLVSQGKSKWTIKETINSTKRFYHVLDTGDASALLSLSPRVKQHAMTSLADWAKYTGRYDKFQQTKQRYNLKWLRVDSTIHLQRFFNEGLTLDVMIQRIRQMIRLHLKEWLKLSSMRIW
jgi:hypothetical protein